MSKGCKVHYNWDGFKTFCGRSILPPTKITAFNVYVTCRACRKQACLPPEANKPQTLTESEA